MAYEPQSERRAAAVLLLTFGGAVVAVVGTALAVVGASALDCSPNTSPWACGLVVLFFLPTGVVMLLAGLAHFIAVVGVRRRRWWGDWLGVGLAVGWLALATLVAYIAVKDFG